MTSPSEEQVAIFSEIASGTSSLVVDATAGSGKTSTIVHATTLIEPWQLTVFLAFNKKIAEELESRLPASVQSSTFHSRAYSALRRSLSNSPKLDKDKVRNLLKENLEYKDFELYGAFASRLVGLAKSAGLGTHIAEASTEEFEELVSHFNLTLDYEEAEMPRAIALAQQALAASNEDISLIDFDDMLYLSLLRNVSFDKASFVFVDEAQDTNGVQRELLKRMLGPTGRLIAVGDSHQAIYGFRGADASALDLIASDFSCKRLPLSISYRCSKAVIREVHKRLAL